jgi:hypothetical protein
MSKQHDTHDDNQHPLRKLLQGLPKVAAAPDFDERLQRRVAAMEDRDRATWFQRCIPAFAYSVLTLVVVGVISYYAFLRVSPNGKQIPSSEQFQHQTEPAGSTPEVQKQSPESQPVVPQQVQPMPKDASVQRKSTPVPPQPQVMQRSVKQPPRESSTQSTGEGAPKREILFTAPAMKSQSALQVNGAQYDSAGIDSIRRLDSLRADSLRQQKPRE